MEDPVQFAGLLRSCGNSKNLTLANRLQSQLLSSQFSRNKFLNNLLVETYGKCGALADARGAFDRIHEPNSYSWNIMLSAYTHNGYLEESKSFFADIPNPDVYAYTTMVTAFAKKGRVGEARQIFDQMPERNLVSWNALFAAYAKNGHLLEARQVFDRMPKKCAISWTILFAAYARAGDLQGAKSAFDAMPNKDTVAWNVMISAYTKAGLLQPAQQVFDSMPAPDVVSWTEMISAYAEKFQLEKAKKLFDAMPMKDMVSWTAMISAYAHNGNSRQAIDLFRLMDLEGLYINKVAFISALDACAAVSALATGGTLHAHAVENGFHLDVNVATSLVNMYGKCARLREARDVFESIPCLQRDVILWNAMITAYAKTQKQCIEALRLFESMGLEGMPADVVTFIGVLTACSHAGKLQDGWSHFVSMGPDYGLVPSRDCYICMGDVLGRAGKLEEAEQLFHSMPYCSDVPTWLALLSACKMHNDPERGRRAAELVVELEPQNPSSYVLVSNVFASSLK